MTFAAESAAAWESIRLFGGRSQSLLQRTPKDPFHLHGVPIKYFSVLSLIFCHYAFVDTVVYITPTSIKQYIN